MTVSREKNLVLSWVYVYFKSILIKFWLDTWLFRKEVLQMIFNSLKKHYPRSTLMLSQKLSFILKLHSDFRNVAIRIGAQKTKVQSFSEKG